MKKSVFVFVLIMLVSCSKGSDAPEEVLPLEPSAPTLIYPNNNEPCLDAVSLNDSQSQIAFNWNQSDNTDNYTLVITNLSTNDTQEIPVSFPPYTATLSKAEPCAWKVIANGETGSTPAESDRWKFYLSGDAQTSYAPFPAELLTPQASSTVSANNDGEITLSWIATDVDSDIATYTLFMDTNDASTEVIQLSYQSGNMQYNIAVETNQTYRWRVVTLDQTGNTSDSGIYGFRVN
jgi:hypothetical protein